MGRPYGLASDGGRCSANIRLQEQVAAIDAKVGELNRAVGTKIILASRRQQLADELAEALYALSSTIYEFKRTIADAPLANDLIADISKQVLMLDTLAAQVTTASKTQQLDTLRERFVDAKGRLNDDLTGLRRMLTPGGSSMTELQTSIEALLDQVGGDKGLLVSRQEELRAVRLINSLQETLQGLGDGLRDQVQALVREAETESDLGIRTLSRRDCSEQAVAHFDRGQQLASGGPGDVAIRVSLRRDPAQGALAQHACGRAGQSGNANSRRRPGRARRHEPGADGVSRQCARDPCRARRSGKSRAAAEAASRTKSAFLANMSHELRTPLNAIIGYSEMLVEDAADRGDKTSIADLQKIQGAGKHLLGLINDILDLSKIEAGRMDIYLEQVYLGRLIDEVSVDRRAAGARRTTTGCDRMPGRHRLACAPTSSKLKQSLINLLSNAAKFTKQGAGDAARLARQRRRRQRGSVFAVIRHRHRHDRRADRPPVPGIHPGRCLDHAQLRRHRSRPHDHAAFLPP